MNNHDLLPSESNEQHAFFGNEPEITGGGNDEKQSLEVQTCKQMGHDRPNHHPHGEHNEPRIEIEEDQEPMISHDLSHNDQQRTG